MGWFGGNKQAETPDPASRQDRQKCWDSRDAYFTCLDNAGVVKAGDEGATCAGPKVQYEKNCAKSWVSGWEEARGLQLCVTFTPL
jgi:cytochrome c oxidase assembly factor 6